jgi:hypothetical protein
MVASNAGVVAALDDGFLIAMDLTGTEDAIGMIPGITGLALLAATVYWSDGATIRSQAARNPQRLLASGLTGARDLGVDAENLYWLDDRDGGALMSCKRSDCSVARKLADAPGGENLAVGSKLVFFGSKTDDALYSAPKP